MQNQQSIEAAPAAPLDYLSNAGEGPSRISPLSRAVVWIGLAVIVALLIWQGVSAAGAPDPTQPRTTTPAAMLDIAVLVFREGLECILVLSAITAGMRGGQTRYRAPIAWGAIAGGLVTIATWFVAVRAVDALTNSISALAVQAATGL
ncbi:MAG TPA: FTR1 family protein, partial [Gemmatimonadaceae bacterium]|nr:FTR1 family protein [Gemmatimonadaceae bacterium]